MAKLAKQPDKDVFAPLERVTVLVKGKGTLSVTDGAGHEYVRRAARPRTTFTVGGALGEHTVSLTPAGGRPPEVLTFRVDCSTQMTDSSGRFTSLFSMLVHTMTHGFEGKTDVVFNGRFYRFLVNWVRDHVHTLKGMKYFDGDLRSAMELWRDSQREDGMIWDNVHEATPATIKRHQPLYGYDDFMRVYPLNKEKVLEFARAPMESDTEYLYVEGIYNTWKATGDDEWMKGMLDSAVRAYRYAMTSAYHWSKKYKLIKRPRTIDTWDFMSDYDQAMAGGLDIVLPGKTVFGIMHGDNTGFAAGCRCLAEMLDRAGKRSEAAKYRNLERDMRRRLNKVAWNGRFFTHHVLEDRRRHVDLGVDGSKQVSLSNAYALNRGIKHSQCVAIIKEYQRLRRRLPKGAPAEWYAIYPPFGKGYKRIPKWQYVNGGVTTIVAGELARGAFQHGFEDYGADILQRVRRLAGGHKGYLHCCFRGAAPERPGTKSRASSEVSYGIPDNWGAAAVTYACVEGLAGVVDQGVAFDKAHLAPRWAAAGTNRAAVAVRYPACRGYAAYRYAHDPKRKRITLSVTGSGRTFDCHCLLPAKAGKVVCVAAGRRRIPFKIVKVRRSRYVDFSLSPRGPERVTITYG